MFEMVAPHSTSDANPLLGEIFFMRVPASQDRAVVPSYPRWTVICPGTAATSSNRSSLAASPMKYRPPVSFDVSSTVHVVAAAFTPADRKQPSCNSDSATSNRGAKTM